MTSKAPLKVVDSRGKSRNKIPPRVADNQSKLREMMARAATEMEHVWISQITFALTPDDMSGAEEGNFPMRPENVVGIVVACVRCKMTYKQGRAKTMCRG